MCNISFTLYCMDVSLIMLSLFLKYFLVISQVIMVGHCKYQPRCYNLINQAWANILHVVDIAVSNLFQLCWVNILITNLNIQMTWNSKFGLQSNHIAIWCVSIINQFCCINNNDMFTKGENFYVGVLSIM